MATWRRRLSLLYARIGIPPLLPSSLWPGGVTFLFQLGGVDLPKLMWRGRGQNSKILAHYVQELAAERILRDQPLPSLGCSLAALFDDVVAEACR